VNDPKKQIWENRTFNIFNYSWQFCTRFTHSRFNWELFKNKILFFFPFEFISISSYSWKVRYIKCVVFASLNLTFNYHRNSHIKLMGLEIKLCRATVCLHLFIQLRIFFLFYLLNGFKKKHPTEKYLKWIFKKFIWEFLLARIFSLLWSNDSVMMSVWHFLWDGHYTKPTHASKII